VEETPGFLRGNRAPLYDGEQPVLAEGIHKSEWILLDYFNFVVHVFSSDCRVFYGLERLWGNAERYECADTA